MARLILDSGAVIALAAHNARARAFVERALRQRIILVLPAVVIAETTRGSVRDAAVNRVINLVDEITPVTEATARQAGRLLAAANIGNATVDALIAAEAVLSDAATIVTGDLNDLSALVDGYPHVRVHLA
jgi:predicted nucleic acid-binding protein